MTEKALIRHLERKERWLAANKSSIHVFRGKRIFAPNDTDAVQLYRHGGGPIFLDGDESGSIKLSVSFRVWQRGSTSLDLAFRYGDVDQVIAVKYFWFSLYFFGMELIGQLPFWFNLLSLGQLKERIKKEDEWTP